ncbi:MAG: uracil-DNA glycosylase [Euryarchaeota archaeon]|nr:uracil-DNA glycosylase [Euryarchaeota archaeon]
MPLDLSCRMCKLHEGRGRVVPPSGDLSSSVVLVGEAPGEKEDALGRPFVGRAGKWLDKCFFEAGLSRDAVMITNTVKCRPPANRRPEPDEVASCRIYLVEDLKNRKLVVALGSTAIEGLLGRKMKVTEVANQFIDVDIDGVGRVKMLMTFHPSACIYNKEARVKLTEALRSAKGFLTSDSSSSC